MNICALYVHGQQLAYIFLSRFLLAFFLSFFIFDPIVYAWQKPNANEIIVRFSSTAHVLFSSFFLQFFIQRHGFIQMNINGLLSIVLSHSLSLSPFLALFLCLSYIYIYVRFSFHIFIMQRAAAAAAALQQSSFLCVFCFIFVMLFTRLSH